MKLEPGKLKVAVLAGGIGSERQISLASGSCVSRALKDAGANVVLSDITPENQAIIDDRSIDVFFIALHGRFGEDGRLQQILEDRSLCYTGSGPEASRLAFDKLASKKAFARAGVAVPPAVEYTAGTALSMINKQLENMGNIFVIKPVTQGSSVGVKIVADKKNVASAAAKCVKDFGDCMIERFLPGRQVTAGILLEEALPVIEIKTKREFYDFHAKYSDEQTEYLFDTVSDAAVEANIKAAALDCFGALGCRDFARVDFVLGDDGIGYALELNSIPGLTSHSLVPKAAEKAGLTMSALCMKIIRAALERKN